TTGSASNVLDFLSHSARIHSLTEDIFLKNSLHIFRNYLKKEVLYGLLHFGQIDASISMEKAIRRYFKDEKTVRLFCRYATYNGSNPYLAPGTLNVIPHLEYGMGAYMPEGGIHSIPKALYALAKKKGVRFHFSEEVRSVRVEKKQVRGIELPSGFYPFDLVISNSDIWPSYRNLLSDQKAPEKTLNQERSSSALIFYWGMNTSFPELDVHNIFFTENYEEEFACLFGKQSLYEDPTVYVHISSKVCKE